jgi:hypothetical protein
MLATDEDTADEREKAVERLHGRAPYGSLHEVYLAKTAMMKGIYAGGEIERSNNRSRFPYGNDRKRSKDKSKSPSFTALRMTSSASWNKALRS